jgi:hypothetical protein
MEMYCHPTTSASSHPLEGVFLGVSIPNRNPVIDPAADGRERQLSDR